MAKSSMKNRDAHGDRKSGLRDYDQRGQRAHGRGDREKPYDGRETFGRGGSGSKAGNGGRRNRKSNDR